MSQYASYYAGTQYDPVDMLMRDADWFNPGVVSASDLIVTQTATASMNVLVTGSAKGSIGGNAWLPNGYRFLNDAQATLAIAAADTTNPRIDLIVACVDTTTTPYTPGLKVIKGTAAASPAVPGITAGLIAIPLYRVYVASNVTTIINSNLTDVRSIASISGIDISLADVGNYFNSANAEGVLQEVGASLADKMSKGGGTFTGVITTLNGAYGIKVGDDAEIGDNNVSNTMFIRGQQDNTQGYLRLGNASFGFGWNGSSYGINNNIIFTQETYGAVGSVTASFTLGLGDANRVIGAWNTAAITITIPNDTTANLPIGAQITVYRGQTGTISFAPASGVTLNSKDTKRSIDGQHASATLIKVAANVWALIGALA
jgi:hypothetical protein